MLPGQTRPLGLAVQAGAVPTGRHAPLAPLHPTPRPDLAAAARNLQKVPASGLRKAANKQCTLRVEHVGAIRRNRQDLHVRASGRGALSVGVCASGGDGAPAQVTRTFDARRHCANEGMRVGTLGGTRHDTSPSRHISLALPSLVQRGRRRVREDQRLRCLRCPAPTPTPTAIAFTSCRSDGAGALRLKQQRRLACSQPQSWQNLLLIASYSAQPQSKWSVSM